MQYLPTAEEQEWLLKELAEVMRQGGYAPLVVSPIVEPTTEFFPESRGSGAFLVDRFTRRLLHYASLDDLEPVLGTFTAESFPASIVPRTPCGSVAACFLGIEEKRCYFGLDANQPSEAEHLAGLMCHEVAHAYRAHHALCREGADEELLTDLTAVYLGFGLLACNNSFRYRQAGDQNWMEWRFSRAGYLTPQAFAFLLAAQSVVREIGAAGQRRLSKLLEANQAEFFDRSLKVLEPECERLRVALCIPEPASWPLARPLPEILQPLPDFVPWTVEERQRVNAGHLVFRVRVSRATLYALAAALMLVPVVVAAAVLGATTPAIILGLVGTAAGTMIGSRNVRETCSDPECRATLPPDAIECPDCGGTISGSIRNRGDRFDAEERLATKPAREPV